MIVTKIGAARSQLNEAITLFFEERDPVSIHTLAGAALQILNDHIQDEGIVWDNSLLFHYNSIYIKDEYRREWYSKVNEARNFFKHADKDIRDGKTSIDFNPTMNDFHIMEAIHSLKVVEGTQCVFSLEIRAYLAWLALNHPRFFKEVVLGTHHNLSGKKEDFAEMIYMAKKHPKITDAILSKCDIG
jgi:hypothetical protein